MHGATQWLVGAGAALATVALAQFGVRLQPEAGAARPPPERVVSRVALASPAPAPHKPCRLRI